MAWNIKRVLAMHSKDNEGKRTEEGEGKQDR